MGVFTMFGTGKKLFEIWVFLEVQEINLLGPLKVNMIIVYFCNFFHLRKSSFRSWPRMLFFEIFHRTTPPLTQMIFFTDFY